MNEEATIAAISSAVGNGGISVIRVSGSQAFEIADRIFRGKRKIAEAASHTILYGKIVDGERMVDEVLVLVMRAPKTYTCEDVVEIDCHGGVLVTRKILGLLIKAGARTAQPGEFTKRAFMNGRIDLSRAEAVMDLIRARSDYALEGSVRQLKGNIFESIVEIRTSMIEDVARIEAALDDPEHLSLDGFLDEFKEKVAGYLKRLQKMERNADRGRMLREGINIVILGKPNVGKSSLLNLLLGEERAIVTDIAGTTRDTLEESINLDGILLNLVDTAGIRQTEDVVEKIGVERSSASAKKADLVLYVVDASIPLSEEDFEILELIREKKGLILLNKSDLPAQVRKEDMEKYSNKIVLELSARKGTGISELREVIEELFYNGKIDFNDEIYLSNMRQKEAVQRAVKALLLVKEGLAQGMPEDFLTIDMMSAYECLGEVIGESLRDDLADTIFEKFCMGK